MTKLMKASNIWPILKENYLGHNKNVKNFHNKNKNAEFLENKL